MVEVVGLKKQHEVEDIPVWVHYSDKMVEKGASRKPTHLMQVKLRRNVRIKDQSTTPSKREMERKAIDRSQLICNPKIEQLRNETERSD